MIPVAIIGASGYTGLELVKILTQHPEFELVYVATSEGETTIQQLHPSLEGVVTMQVEKADASEVAKVAQIAFLALPHKTSMGFASQLLELGVKVVDLSADYRLKLDRYEAHYCKHTDTKHLCEAAYGLPEFYRNKIKESRIIANPGCYPTASLLGLLPFIPYIKKDTPIFIDAKSGVSGAGKKLSSTTHYVTINENIFAYNPIKHRHAPEIAEKIDELFVTQVEVNFVPHLIPVTRGMLCSIYMQLENELDPIEVLESLYKDEPFVRVRNNPVDIKSVAGTNFCDIYATMNGNSLFISSAIDNLLRGASSQAVVNANIICGFDETLGIPQLAYVP
ncbi:N-acetyl-gamma-glutamyl-phosphate reductase [Hydrogenimonas thermophila]|uniref:N-acetyl-gamma-glutamyl-phosphate reductase n=1 Tax=Hydrogenimonas thermophila TaxID=223786 RepID=A0A1I5MBL4_9BACT|nr:N-acetyl-gamma-glutamyl-phosphate reductase [Hydrogenimonas thermophila]WOE70635.1 N-acetyl-gamma-glutamyl-phosphate reductase [Hydrogenimonas thermophila]WOE73153.1 N-acetyl-gamma-glutamyl-phosphate reductase [Hydrogenimonas thermophila]SFP06900.1 N-acetyl-gamma-glutamyl-phosphate reductase [Hydrogenimonas thermophila]